MKANPKHLILDLLLALGDKPLAVRDAIHAAAIFDIGANSLRVTLARLTAQGLIEIAERGAYRLGPAATGLAGEVATWRTVEQRLRPWQGGYIAVHCGALGRSDRVALRRRERALQMLGFRELERGLHIRPDNLERDIDEVRRRLHTLGLDHAAAVFQAQGFDTQRDAAIHALWDGKALTQTYRELRDQLEAWLDAADIDAERELAVAACESFALGGRAIRHIVFDPLLPEPFVDAAERHAFIAATHRFDQAGRAIWGRFFDAIPSRSTLSSGDSP